MLRSNVNPVCIKIHVLYRRRYAEADLRTRKLEKIVGLRGRGQQWLLPFIVSAAGNYFVTKKAL
jgi:hypothetical protein